MLHAVVRFIFLTLIRFFHRQIAVRGREHLPAAGPVLVVANHPNGLLDPLVIRAALGREVGFMAKAPLFENPFGKLAMDSFAALPVYRSKDGRDTSGNDKTFEAVDARFGDGRWVVIFPEGHSHSEPSLQRVKTGAARMSLAAEAKRDFGLGLKILPTGLIYEDKETFRSRVSVVIGQPINVADYAAAHAEDDWEAAQSLTADLAAAIADVMLEADDAEVWQGFLAVARWTDAASVTDIAACEARARELSKAYQALLVADPEQADAIADDARRFVTTLAALGIDDPFNLERPAPTLPQVVRNAVWYALGAPAALIGWVLNAPPYYIIAPLARRIAGDDNDIVSTVKALGGMLFYPITWLIEAALATWFIGPWAGLAVGCLGPLTGFIAVRYFERLLRRRDAIAGTWLRFTRGAVVDAVIRQRAELSAKVNDALGAVTPRVRTDMEDTSATPA